MAGATGFFPPLVSDKKVYNGAYLIPQECKKFLRNVKKLTYRQEINKVCYLS